MSNVHILGSLSYHNDTILKPIYTELRKQNHNTTWWFEKVIDGANVHIPECTDEVIKYWNSFSNIVSYLKKGDKILIADFWNPEIFKLKFYVTRLNLDIKFYTIHHGSSDLPGDFAGQDGYEFCKSAEEGWFACYDGVFFGSYNAADQVLKRRGSRHFQKFYVTYLPIDYITEIIEKCQPQIREPNSAIMPLRMDQDKGVDEFLTFVKSHPHIHFHASSPTQSSEIYASYKNLTVHDSMDRVDLFNLMRKCTYVVSFAKQETFGYGVLEAVMNGCTPVLFDSPFNCYSEFYPEENLFKDYNEIDWERAKNSDEILGDLLEKIGSAKNKIAKYLTT